MERVRWIICAALLLCCGAGGANSLRIDWSSINSGGGLVSGGANKLNCSIGQAAAGFVNNTSLLHWIGFWAGDVPTPTVAPKIADAKLLPEGTFVSVSGKVATSAESDFTGFFYLEESDRSSGIRISAGSGAVTGLVRGRSVVNVIGTLGTLASGERQIAASLIVITSTNPLPLRALGMNNLWVGGGDLGSPPLGQYGVTDGSGLNNVGLLVMTWGLVTAKDPGGQYIVIDDGSGMGVRVDTSGLASVPDVDEHISVIGISSLYKPGADRLRLVLPRVGSDMTIY